MQPLPTDRRVMKRAKGFLVGLVVASAFYELTIRKLLSDPELRQDFLTSFDRRRGMVVE